MTILTHAHTDFLPSLRRISVPLLRNVYLLRNSGPRLLALAYWPTIQMILWGFITLFLMNRSSWLAQASGVLLWDVLFRGQLGVSLVFMEEMWSRNLGHLFVSPLRPFELACTLLTMSLIRTLFGAGGAALIAIPLFHYSIFSMGLPLLVFFVNLLIMGWSIGLLVSGIVLRYGARRREPGVDRHFRGPTRQRRLLSDQHLADMAAVRRRRAAIQPRI